MYNDTLDLDYFKVFCVRICVGTMPDVAVR